MGHSRGVLTTKFHAVADAAGHRFDARRLWLGLHEPIRKLYYNLTITVISVLVAVVIGGVETLGLIGESFKPEGAFWSTIGALNDNFGLLVYGIVAIFALSWIVLALIYKVMGYDAVEARVAPPSADQL